MATLIETLIDVLDQECDIFDQLISVSRDKTQAIVAGDMDRLNAISGKEQEVVDRITNLEKKREEASSDILSVLGLNPEGTLTDIIDALKGQGDEQNELKDVHDRLLSKVKELKADNDHNSVLVNDQLEMIQFNLNALQSLNQAPEVTTYGRGAYAQDVDYGEPRGSFDSKS